MELIIPSDNRILYYARDRVIFGFLSHFHPAPILLDGEIWPTPEHFYQAQKSASYAYKQAVMRAPTPAAAKRLAADPRGPAKRGRHSWFAQNGALPRADWNDIKLDVMRRADFAKFSQHDTLRYSLLATEDAELIEDSPSEEFWGTGPDGRGSKWAGRILMETRSFLRDR